MTEIIIALSDAGLSLLLQSTPLNDTESDASNGTKKPSWGEKKTDRTA